MYSSSILPIHKVVLYANDPQAGCYTKTIQQPDKTPVMRLPYQLIVEPTQVHEIKCNDALQIIRGKEKFKKGNFKFFTGLRDTNFKQWYAGNDYEFIHGKKILSLCLFHFSIDNSRLTIFYFGRFYIDAREPRERFVNDAIPVILNKHFLSGNLNRDGADGRQNISVWNAAAG